MAFICHYFCCCCYKQKNKTKKDVKNKIMTEQKRKTLHDIDLISRPETDAWAHTSDPLNVESKEMTDEYMVSEEYVDEKAVLEHKGYKIENIGSIGHGGNATVHKTVHLKSGLMIACKQITIHGYLKDKERDEFFKDLKSELYVLQKIKHPHVIQLIDHFIITYSALNQKKLYIMMRYASGGDLSKECAESGPFDELKCKLWLAQILSAMVFMHSKGIAHRDLKLANVLLDEFKEVLITDFGFSRLIGKGKDKILISKTLCGTEPFMAPELLDLYLNKASGGYNAFEVDVWAIGIILFKLFTKEYPFPPEKRGLKRMLKKKWKINNTLNSSNDLKSFLKKTFEPNPQLRAKMSELSTHKWIFDVFREVDEMSSQKIANNDIFIIPKKP